MQTIAPKHSLPADKAAAGLSLATHLSQLSQGISPQALSPLPVAPQTPQNAPGQEQAQPQQEPFDNSQNEAKLTEIEAKMEQMKTEMESTIKGEISGIKDLIIEVLKDDEQTG